MSLSNLERCQTWIAQKPNVDEIRAKLATVEEKLLALDDCHPKRKDIEETMQELLTHLQLLDSSARTLTVSKIEMAITESSLSFETDPSVKTISDPQERQSAFELLKSQLGSGSDLLKQKHLVA
ncbi:MAG: hypothetical protein ACJAS1_005848 [Oleiphilaceae bacterium]|jgi:hypothetical protein